jgi:hypothetical protein
VRSSGSARMMASAARVEATTEGDADAVKM